MDRDEYGQGMENLALAYLNREKALQGRCCFFDPAYVNGSNSKLKLELAGQHSSTLLTSAINVYGDEALSPSQAHYDLFKNTLNAISYTDKDFDKIYAVALIAASEENSFDKRVAATLEIINHLASCAHSGNTPTSPVSDASRFLEWVESNYHRKITMNDAAEFFGYSKNYFCRWLKISVGTGFSEFLNVVRISHACAYLLDGYTIEATAEICGFSDPSYFIKVFKRLRGTTPKKYLAENRGGELY